MSPSFPDIYKYLRDKRLFVLGLSVLFILGWIFLNLPMTLIIYGALFNGLAISLLASFWKPIHWVEGLFSTSASYPVRRDDHLAIHPNYLFGYILLFLGLLCLSLGSVLTVVEGGGNKAIWQALTALGTILVAVIALFKESIMSFVQSPQLKVTFDSGSEDCLHHVTVSTRIVNAQTGEVTEVFPKDSYNCLLLVENTTGHTAKNAVAKIYYIHDPSGTRHRYSPTPLNWSGMQDPRKPIDIYGDTHHFLDFFTLKDYTDGLLRTDRAGQHVRADRASRAFEAQFPELLCPVIELSWLPAELGGIKKHFNDDGDYLIEFVITADNCKPHKYQAHIRNWSRSEWASLNMEITKV
jgi:hypothetical protein